LFKKSELLYYSKSKHSWRYSKARFPWILHKKFQCNFSLFHNGHPNTHFFPRCRNKPKTD